MRKEKLGNFFKGKGFYTALAVGTVAILAVGILNTNMISDSNNELAKNPSSQISENTKQEGRTTSENEILKNDEIENYSLENEASEIKKEEIHYNTTEENTNNSELSNKENIKQETLEKVAKQEVSEQQITTKQVENQELSQQEVVEKELASQEIAEQNEISSLIEPTKLEAEPIQKVEVEEKVAEVLSKESQVSSLNFSEEDGLLWPVQGNVILEYSMDKPVYFKTLEQYKCNSAIAIEAKEKTEVFSVAKCMITDISNVDETGITVKASIGNDYEVIYGQLSDVQVEVGDIVEAGAVIGMIGAPTKYYVEEGSHLYFKVLAGNEPVNPLLLLN